MAAVMRAMSGMGSLGKTHSRSESTGDQLLSSRVSSEDLSRTTSRLAPPGPAAPSPGGILINSNRPYAAESSAASSVASIPRTTSASDLARLNTPTTTHSRDASPAPGRSRDDAPLSPSTSFALLASPSAAESDRGRSRSSSRHGPADSTDSTAMIARSIRFAPLPEVRQRSYSTGRNLWYEDEDITDGMLTDGHDGPKRDLVRRDAPDQMDFPEHALADSSSEEDSPPAGIFGSWKSDLGMGGGSSHAKEKDRDRDEPSSYTVKLLRPLSFGLVGKKRPATPKPGRRPSTADASDLARIESNESDVSRGSSEAVVHKSTGIPMRKTRTWELGETPTSSRRANYPPVAQRSRRPATATSISAPDPSFVEWGWGKEGSGKGVGSVRNAKAAATNDEDEDGGGMAWVKRRKAEREAAAAKKKAEDEASAAVAELMEPTVAPSDPVVTPDVVVSAPPSTSGTTTPVPATSLLSASRPALYVVTPSLDSSLLVDQDTAAPSPSHTAASRSSSSLSTPSTESSSMSSGDAGKTLTPTGVVSEGGKSEGEESEDEGESDSDSDLDEDELAQEEALAEAARMTAKSAASERYHDKNHTTRMLKVDT